MRVSKSLEALSLYVSITSLKGNGDNSVGVGSEKSVGVGGEKSVGVGVI
jgi:hypothetical protein